MSESEREVARKMGWLDYRQPFGHHPALLVVDVVESFTGSAPQPTLEAVDEYATSCGASAWTALDAIARLLAGARAAEIPVIYTKGDPYLKANCGDSVKATRPQDIERLYSAPIHAAVAPQAGELVLQKTKASGFFATPLATYLTHIGADCLIICGTTTSGCVRATVVDGWSNGYPCFVVEEGCFDRFDTSHLVNLFDLNAKYADVITLDEALALIAAQGGTQQTPQSTVGGRS